MATRVKCIAQLINNPSFEDGSVGWDFSHSPHWNQGVTSPGPLDYPPNSIPDGEKVAYVTSNGYISQTLAATIDANTTYTLTVYVGHPIYPLTPPPFEPSFTYSVQLRHAGTLSEVLTSTSDYDPGPGNFGMLTFSYNSGQNPTYGGDHLEIGLMGSGAYRVDFDKITLDAVPVPPTVWLLGSALLGLVGWRRFRKN